MDDPRILDRLRAISSSLPGATETTMHGHPTFRAGKNMFTMLHGRPGEPAIAVKVGRAAQAIFLKDTRFYATPHIGRYGWVSIHASAGMNWDEVAELVRGSHQIVSAKPARPR